MRFLKQHSERFSHYTFRALINCFKISKKHIQGLSILTFHRELFKTKSIMEFLCHFNIIQLLCSYSVTWCGKYVNTTEVLRHEPFFFLTIHTLLPCLIVALPFLSSRTISILLRSHGISVNHRFSPHLELYL